MPAIYEMANFLKVGIVAGKRPVSKKPKEPMIVSLPNGVTNKNGEDHCEVLALYSASIPVTPPIPPPQEKDLDFEGNGVKYKVTVKSKIVDNQNEELTFTIIMTRPITAP